MIMTHPLIEEIAPMKILARSIQNESLTDKERHVLLDQLNLQYMQWFGKVGMSILPFYHKHLDDFMKEYKGGILVSGIQAFLQRGWMLYKYYHEGSPFTPRWVVDVERAFVNRLDEQVRIIAGLLEVDNG